jgi:arsenate reductase (glutaredoxin)
VTITLYGIKNCDTVKKARAWLDARGVDYAFHDYKIEGIDRARLAAWSKELGWGTLLNRAGTTFRRLSDADKHDIDESKALALMLVQPSLIKRPMLDLGKTRVVGFSPERYDSVFAAR